MNRQPTICTEFRKTHSSYDFIAVWLCSVESFQKKYNTADT